MNDYIKKLIIKKVMPSFLGVTFLSFLMGAIVLFFLIIIIVGAKDSKGSSNNDGGYATGGVDSEMTRDYEKNSNYLTDVISRQQKVFTDNDVTISTYDIMYADELTNSIVSSNSINSCIEKYGETDLHKCFSNVKNQAAWSKEHKLQLGFINSGIYYPYDSNFIVSSAFGPRYLEGLGNQMHTGIDLIATEKTVISGRAGKVIAQHDGCANNTSLTPCGLLSGGNGIVTSNTVTNQEIFIGYYHLETNVLSVGDEVKINQKIGIEGSTGMSTGSHLHLEFGELINGKYNYYDPFLFLIPFKK